MHHQLIAANGAARALIKTEAARLSKVEEHWAMDGAALKAKRKRNGHRLQIKLAVDCGSSEVDPIEGNVVNGLPINTEPADELSSDRLRLIPSSGIEVIRARGWAITPGYFSGTDG